MAFCIQRCITYFKRASFLTLKDRSRKSFLSTGHLNLFRDEKNMFHTEHINYEVQKYYTAIRNFNTKHPNQSEPNTKGLVKKNLDGGVVIVDVIVGNGTVAKSGKTVTVYYSGRLKSESKVFDELKEGSGLSFRLGRGDVIDGWDVGVVGMKVGGKRIITCPPSMAYGTKGYPPVIPPNSTLVFEVELKSVE